MSCLSMWICMVEPQHQQGSVGSLRSYCGTCMWLCAGCGVSCTEPYCALLLSVMLCCLLFLLLQRTAMACL